MARREEEFWAACFMGADPEAAASLPRVAFPRSTTGQSLPSGSDEIRQLIRESVAGGIEEGARRVRSNNSNVGAIMLGALVITAVATATMAVVLITRD